MNFLNFILPIILCLSISAVTAKKDIDIELAYKLLLQDQLKQGRIFYNKAETDTCELQCPADCNLRFFSFYYNHFFYF